mgnify:CR=1 FL=1
MSSQILGYSASNALAGDVNSLNGLKNEATNKTPQAAREAAKQLESLFMREMIKSMRQATMKSGLIDQEGGGGDLARDMYDQQIAKAMSEGRGLGLAPMIARQLGATDAATPAVPATTALSAYKRLLPGTDADSMLDAIARRGIGSIFVRAIGIDEQDAPPHFCACSAYSCLMVLFHSSAR